MLMGRGLSFPGDPLSEEQKEWGMGIWMSVFTLLCFTHY